MTRRRRAALVCGLLCLYPIAFGAELEEDVSLARLPDSLLLTLRWSALEAVPRAAPIHTVVPTSVFDLVDELGVDWLSVTSARGADPAAPLRARSLPPAGSLVEAQCGPLCDQGKWDALRRAISGLSGAAVSGVPAWDAASRSAAWLPPSALASDARAPGTAELHRAAFPVDEACLEHFGRLLDLVPCGPAEGAKDLFFRTRRVPFSYYGFQVSVFAPAGKPSAGERAAGFELTLRLQLHRQHEAALFSALGSRNMTGCGAANRTSVASGPDSRVQRVYPSSSLAIDPSLFGDPPETDAAAMAAAEPDESPLGAWRSVEELEGSRARLHYRLALATTPTGTGANVTVEDLLPWYVRPVASSIRVEGPRRGGAAEPSLRLEPSWSRTAPSKLTVTASLLPGDSLAVSIELHKEFLTVDEFPPDASRGLDLPPAAVFVEQAGCRGHACADGGPECDEPICHGPPRATLFLPGVLVMMPYPDASMPYNVITLSGTVFAFAAGSLWSLIARRG